MTPPDKISEAIERLQDGMKRAKDQNWEASVLRHKDVETLIQAATTPAAQPVIDDGELAEAQQKPVEVTAQQLLHEVRLINDDAMYEPNLCIQIIRDKYPNGLKIIDGEE